MSGTGGVRRSNSLQHVSPHNMPAELSTTEKKTELVRQSALKFPKAVINRTASRTPSPHLYEEERDALIGNLAETRLRAIALAHKEYTDGVGPITSSNKKLNALLKKIASKIARGPSAKESVHDYTQSIRESVDAALSLFYGDIKPGDCAQEKEYLGHLVYAFIMTADASTPFREFGEHLVKIYADGAEKESYSLDEMASKMDRCVLGFSKYHETTVASKVFSKMFHVRQSKESFIGQFGPDPIEYNAYRAGNADGVGGYYRLGNTNVRFQYGPTPTGDLLYLEKLKQLKKHDGLDLRHNLQHPEVSGEFERSELLVLMEKKYAGTMRLFATPMDGPVLKMKPPYNEGLTTGADFIKKYANFAITGQFQTPPMGIEDIYGSQHRQFPSKEEAHHDNGFYIGPEVMDDGQFRLAFKVVEEVFGDLDLSGEEGRDLAQTLQLITQGIISYGALHQLASDAEARGSKLEPNFGQACKQDIDRGVALNVTTRILARLEETGGEVSVDEMNEMIGAVVGRSEMVDGRMILLKHRYQLLSNALPLIREYSDKLTKALKKYSSSFTPQQESPPADPKLLEAKVLHSFVDVNDRDSLLSTIYALRPIHSLKPEQSIESFLKETLATFSELSKTEQNLLIEAFQNGPTAIHSLEGENYEGDQDAFLQDMQNDFMHFRQSGETPAVYFDRVHPESPEEIKASFIALFERHTTFYSKEKHTTLKEQLQ